MSPARFNSFLVANDVGHEPPAPRLTVPERWCWIAGVKAIASKSPIRGALLIALGEPATTDDIRRQADVPRATAKSTLDKLVRFGVLEHDDELGCLIFVDWHDEQREPKASDSREAWRDRKQKQRNVPRDVTRDNSAGHEPNGHAVVTPLSPAVPFAPAREEGKRREGKG